MTGKSRLLDALLEKEPAENNPRAEESAAPRLSFSPDPPQTDSSNQ